MSDYRYDHPLEEDLHAYLDGELPAGQMGAIAEHLEECAQCRQQLGEIERLFRQIESLTDEVLEGSYARVITGRLGSEQSSAQAWRWVLLVQFGTAGILAWFTLPLAMGSLASGWNALASWLSPFNLEDELRSVFLMLQDVVGQVSGGIQGIFDIRLPVLPVSYPVAGWWVLLILGGGLWLIFNRWLLGNGGNSTKVPNRRA